MPIVRSSPRVDYDAIAHLYDTQPHRGRDVDPQLQGFAAERAGAALTVLDIGCGTGNQLIANCAALPQAWCVGLDSSRGMLARAYRKAPGIAWVHGDGAVLPFRAGSFDFAYSQFAFHHVQDRSGMLSEVCRVLRPRGKFALHNACPQESSDWLYYEYFPEARAVDLDDFWPPDTIVASMKKLGFVNVEAAYQHLRWEQDMAAWLDTIRRRDTCSQLQAISDAAYRAGLDRLERDVADPKTPRSRADHLCLITIHGEAHSPAV
jgi:ubiquinone/menaquinone biosynthesis C-methylase UbiE